MYLPQMISSIDDSQKTGDQRVFDFTRTFHIKTSRTETIFVLLTIQSIKKVADPNKHGNHIIADIHHLIRLHPPSTLNNLTLIIQKIVDHYKVAFHIQLIMVTIQADQHKLIAASSNPTSILLYRNQQTIKIPCGPQGVSGPILESDYLMLPSQQFLQNTSAKLIVECFKSPHQGLNKLVDSHDPALMIGFKADNDSLKIPQKDTKTPKLPKFNLSLNLNKQTTSSFRKKTFLGKRRRFALIMAFIFVGLLSLTLYVGHEKRQKLEHERVKQQLAEDVSYRLKQAESLKELNTLRAKTLLQEAKSILNQYQQQYTSEDVDIQALADEVNIAYAAVVKQYIITEPEIFYSLNLVKEGFKSSQISYSEGVLTLLDNTSSTIIQVNTDKKSAEIVSGSDIVPNNPKLASIPAWIFLSANNRLQIIDPEKKEQLKSFTLSTIQVDQLIGYSNNAYILDKSIGQLWRFRGTVNGLNKPDRFFKEDQDLSYVSLATIDGSVWFLRDDGGIEKYTTGINDAYYPQLELDIPLGTPTAFYTDDTSDHLYILDPDNHRVVVLTKQAQYTSQYLWGKIDQDTQMAVSEDTKKLFLVKDDKIYGIDLRD